MDILCEKDIKVNGKSVTLKIDMKALYKTQQELGLSGIYELATGLDKLDIILITSLIKQCAVDVDLDENEVLDILEIKNYFLPLTTWLSCGITSLFVRTEDGEEEKK